MVRDQHQHPAGRRGRDPVRREHGRRPPGGRAVRATWQPTGAATSCDPRSRRTPTARRPGGAAAGRRQLQHLAMPPPDPAAYRRPGVGRQRERVADHDGERVQQPPERLGQRDALGAEVVARPPRGTSPARGTAPGRRARRRHDPNVSSTSAATSGAAAGDGRPAQAGVEQPAEPGPTSSRASSVSRSWRKFSRIVSSRSRSWSSSRASARVVDDRGAAVERDQPAVPLTRREEEPEPVLLVVLQVADQAPAAWTGQGRRHCCAGPRHGRRPTPGRSVRHVQT